MHKPIVIISNYLATLSWKIKLNKFKLKIKGLVKKVKSSLSHIDIN